MGNPRSRLGWALLLGLAWTAGARAAAASAIAAVSDQSSQVRELGRIRTGAVVETTPLVLQDGTVVFGSFDSHVYFLKPESETGYRVHPRRTRGPVSSSPRLTRDGDVMVGSSDGRVYFYDADGNETGRVHIGGFIWSSPAEMLDGTLVVGSHDGFVAFFRKDGTVLSKFQTEVKPDEGAQVNSSPLVLADGGVAVGANDGYVYLFNPDRTLRGKIKTGNSVWSSPRQFPGNPYEARIVVGSTDGTVNFIDPWAVRVHRRFMTGGDVTATPLITREGKVVIGSFDGKVYVLDRNGSLLGSIALPRRGASTPPPIWAGATEMPDGTVVAGAMDGYVFFLDVRNLRILAAHPTGQGIFAPAAVVAPGKIAVGSHDFHLHFLELVGAK